MARILLKNISLQFPKTFNYDRSLRNRFIKALKGNENNFEFISSLKNVNIEVNEGDVVGVVGPNGSGKSSLLRIIAGIYYPSTGLRVVEGKILTLLDLNTGMEPENTGYENIFLLSYLRGYKRNQINKFVNQVVEFSELGDAILKPVRTYSSGMVSRLAASMILHFRSEIILLDEFISTGDIKFQDKFKKFMSKKLNNTKIVIIATHDQKLVKKICNRVLTIEKGNVSEISIRNIAKYNGKK
jgi:ABC-type polysaccharide/polyol phosphate transport system ATPase subunit